MSPNKTKSLAFGGQLSQQEIDVYILSPGSADPPVLSKYVGDSFIAVRSRGFKYFATPPVRITEIKAETDMHY